MAHAIWKYPLEIVDYLQGKSMPEGAQIVHVGLQNNIPTIWALVETTKRPEDRFFGIIGTGHEFSGEHWKHVGTCEPDQLGLVWHVLELGK
jgi:hypothetical protein